MLNKRRKKELVSIVLPTYNGSKYIAQSIESCLRQSYRNLELIIVNDASVDDTHEIILSFKDSRIVYLTNAVNSGLPKTLNKGFAESRGDYLTWTSDDNYYTEEALAVMLMRLKQKENVDFVYSSYYIIDDNGKKVDTVEVSNSLNLLIHNCIGPCFLYKRKIYKKIGNYNPGFFLAEDYEYWIRVLKKFRMKNLDDCLYYYRSHDGSLTATYTSETAKTAFEKAYKQHVNLELKIRFHLMKFFCGIRRKYS